MSQKILVIDDDPSVLRYLETLLADHGYDVTTAPDGVDGMKALEQDDFDLITLDLEMNKQWGPQFFRAISKNPAWKGIPVVVISGLSRPDLAIKNAAAVIGKPFEASEVLDAVAHLLGGDK
jgi:CheY-like chemotaxis protein